MKYLTVHVTQEDIDKGVRSRGDLCAFALAMKRVDRDIGFVSPLRWVRMTRRHWWSRVRSETFRMPQAASSWIIAFDWGEAVKPATFDLPLEPYR